MLRVRNRVPGRADCCASGARMQAAMEVAQRHCSAELESYAQCVAANPATWSSTCHDLKAKVSKCTSSHPAVRKIQAACAHQFLAFESCLKENAATVLRCSSHVDAFLACAEGVDTRLPLLTPAALTDKEKS